MNQGELDELKCKIFLTYLRDSRQCFLGNIISQLGNTPTQNYGSFASAGCNIFAVQGMNELQTEHIALRIGISKSPTRAKADVFINGSGVSLKSLSAAPPAIVNHTARPGFETACQYANANIASLDAIIDRYWQLRTQGIIAEDTKISDPACPFNGNKDIMKPILEYFLFMGTGSGPSDYQATNLVEFADPLNIQTYRLLTPSQAVDNIWGNLIFSMRAKKGMPSNYNPNTYSKDNAASIRRWVRFIDGDYRGALHIRTGR